VRILGNEYRSLCDMLWVKSTNFITDCGLHSASEFMNGDFTYGHCYWTMEGDAGAEDSQGFARNGGSIYEGLYLAPGEYVFTAEVGGQGALFVRPTLGGEDVAVREFEVPGDGREKVELKFRIPSEGDYSLGLRSATQAGIKNTNLARK
ncbi:MAG: hypothetical protein IK076_01090, partial [Bacteroidales bacterium]|nr:hypothetical protein [Bacteroidales bacterium]